MWLASDSENITSPWISVVLVLGVKDSCLPGLF